MADCECLPKCVFFNDKMADTPNTADMMKKRYCIGDNSNCARHVVFLALGGSKVPGDLYPNQMDKAKSFLSANS